MTGRMPSLHGVRYNGISLSLAANTFVDLFRAAGWRTALIGKSHLQNMTGMPTVVEKPKLPDGYQPPPAGFDEAEKDDYDRRGLRAGERPRLGQKPDTLRSACPITASTMSSCAQATPSRCMAPTPAGCASAGPTPIHCAARRRPCRRTMSLPQAWRTSLPEELYPTSYVVDRTIAYLEDARRNDSAPFFLQCSFPDPHHPFTPPGRYWDLYKPQDMELPPSFRIGNRTLPPHAAGAASPRAMTAPATATRPPLLP